MTKIEQLDATHDRPAFSCGVPTLDRYLRETARQHILKGISKTFVLVSETASAPKPILGFFTLSFCEVDADALPAKWSKHLPDGIPAFKLGRLAIAKQHQGQGYGRALMLAAIMRIADAQQHIGGVGLFVDAKDDQVAKFYEQFGFERVAPELLSLFLPTPTIVQIAKS